MNRNQRRATRIKGPKGETLECRLLLISDRDASGRPTSVKVCYDEQTIGDVVEGRTTGVEFLLVWMVEGQGKKLD